MRAEVGAFCRRTKRRGARRRRFLVTFFLATGFLAAGVFAAGFFAAEEVLVCRFGEAARERARRAAAECAPKALAKASDTQLISHRIAVLMLGRLRTPR